MVADVQLLQTVHQRLDDLRIPVTQVEDTAVAVAVNEPLASFDVMDVRAFPPAQSKIDPGRFEESRFSRGNMSGKEVIDLFYVLVLCMC